MSLKSILIYRFIFQFFLSSWQFIWWRNETVLQFPTVWILWTSTLGCNVSSFPVFSIDLGMSRGTVYLGSKLWQIYFIGGVVYCHQEAHVWDDRAIGVRIFANISQQPRNSRWYLIYKKYCNARQQFNVITPD